MRATNVVKILTKNSGLDPKRITAAGRGEYVPLVEQLFEQQSHQSSHGDYPYADLTELANLLDSGW